MIGACFRRAQFLASITGRRLLLEVPKEDKKQFSARAICLDTKQFSQKKSRQQIDPADLRALNQPDPIEEAKKNRKKTTPIPQVYLRDEKGRLLGLMTVPEALLLARKHKRALIKTDVSKKIPTYKFQDPRLVGDSDVVIEEVVLAESESESGAKTNKKSGTNSPPKTVAFTSNASEHDVVIKINQVKKFIRKGHDTLVRVTSTGDLQRLEEIFNQFSEIFNEKNGTRINQKRLTETNLKFNIVPVDLKLIKSQLQLDANLPADDDESIIDLSKIDPNQLLEDETIIDRLKKK